MSSIDLNNSKKGKVYGWVAFGSGDHTVRGLPWELLTLGLEEYIKKILIPLVQKTKPDDVIIHLPFGRSSKIDGDMELHGRSECIKNGFGNQTLAINTEKFVAAWEEYIKVIGKSPIFYVGTVTGTNKEYWSNISTHEIIEKVLYELDPLIKVPGASIVLDVAGVEPENSMSAFVRSILKTYTKVARIGCEPRPSLDAEYWANDPSCLAITTDQLWSHTSESGNGIGGGWAIPVSKSKCEHAVIMGTYDINTNIPGYQYHNLFDSSIGTLNASQLLSSNVSICVNIHTPVDKVKNFQWLKTISVGNNGNGLSSGSSGIGGNSVTGPSGSVSGGIVPISGTSQKPTEISGGATRFF